MKVNKNVIVVGVLALLLIVGVVQAIQLGSIRSNVNDISISSSSSSTGKISTSTSASAASSSTGGVPTNIQNLPGMVGGC